jgi:hypothetical protein
VQVMFAKKAKRSIILCLAGKGCSHGDFMSKARAALVVLGDTVLIGAVVLLLEIDKLINGTLYNYGLDFSYDWAQPYWLMFRVTLVLIVVAVILISVVELPYPAFEDKE